MVIFGLIKIYELYRGLCIVHYILIWVNYFYFLTIVDVDTTGFKRSIPTILLGTKFFVRVTW